MRLKARDWHPVAIGFAAGLCWSCQRFPAEYLYAKPTALPTANVYPVPQAADQQTDPKYPGVHTNTNGKISGGSDPCLQSGGIPEKHARAAAESIADSQVDYLVLSGPQFFGLKLQPKIGTTEFQLPYPRLYVRDHATAVAILDCLRRATIPCTTLPSIQFPMIDVYLKRTRSHADRVVKFTLVGDEGNHFRPILSVITAPN